jgi:hypothetical protein
MSEKPSKRPWPMKWIVIAILGCIVPYTWLTLQFRKPNPAYQPYHDTKERAQVKRLLDSGIRRLHLAVEEPAVSQTMAVNPTASVQPAPGGLPTSLRETLLDEPFLPIAVTAVRAAARSPATTPYPIEFTCTQRQPRDHRLLLVTAYLQGETLTLVPTFNEPQGSASERSREITAQVKLPVGLLKTGTYTVLLAGRNQSRSWQVQIED